MNDIISPENLVYKKPDLLNDTHMHYCAGCSHGMVHKLVAEVIEEMGMQNKTVGVSPVGCAVFAYNYIDIDWQEAAHGRAPACATAIKRLPCIYIPGRRRHGLYRYCRKHTRTEPWREHHSHLHQQRHLWYDWWTDGSYYSYWTEDLYLPLRTRPETARMATQPL